MRVEHRFQPAHYQDDGTIVRLCAHCLTRRELTPRGLVTFVTLSGARSSDEPACAPLLSAGQTGAAA
jgi:hypothetical protein